MRKPIALFVAVMMTFAFTLPASACWMAPEPFEISSDDGSRIFVFIPDEHGSGNAYAGVYEIVNNERQVVYAVQDLSSFAYEGNFYFSADMTHFIRTFPAPGMPVFEAFTNGVRTRVVMRNDFIRDYASEEGFTSIGPSYTIHWRIEEHSPENGTVTIRTDEGNAFIFDLAAARFDSEDILPARYDALPEASPDPITQTPNPYATVNEATSEAPSVPNPQTQNSPILVIVIASVVAAFITAGVFVLHKRKTQL